MHANQSLSKTLKCNLRGLATFYQIKIIIVSYAFVSKCFVLALKKQWNSTLIFFFFLKRQLGTINGGSIQFLTSTL